MGTETDRLIRPCVRCKYHRVTAIGYHECTRNARHKINRVHGDTYVVGNTLCETERAPWWARLSMIDSPVFVACGPSGKFFQHNVNVEASADKKISSKETTL